MSGKHLKCDSLCDVSGRHKAVSPISKHSLVCSSLTVVIGEFSLNPALLLIIVSEGHGEVV